MIVEEIIDTKLKPIAEEGFQDALEILQLIAILKTQNINNVNKGLTKAGAERWSHFLRQPAKVDSPMQRTNHHEDAETVFRGVQGQGCA